MKSTAWLFPLYFQVPLPGSLKKPVFIMTDLRPSKVPARLDWDLLTRGRYQPACHYFLKMQKSQRYCKEEKGLSNWKLYLPKCGRPVRQAVLSLPHFGRYSFQTQQSIFCIFARFLTFYKLLSLSIQGSGKKNHHLSLRRGRVWI